MKFAEDGCSMFGCLRWGSFDAFGSAFLGLSLWESCFSLVPPLWESCYSLDFWLGNALGRGGGGVVHSLRRTPCFPSVFLPFFYTSHLLFSFLLSFWLHCHTPTFCSCAAPRNPLGQPSRCLTILSNTRAYGALPNSYFICN